MPNRSAPKTLLIPLLKFGGAFLLGGTLLMGSAAAADSWSPFHGAYPLKVVATTGVLADIVGHIAGDKASVRTLIKGDPHLFKPASEDLSQLAQADLIIANGLFLEPKLTDILTRLGHKQRVVAVGDRIDHDLLLRSGQFEKQYDPHIWFDLVLAQKTVEIVRDAFVAMDPPNAAYYQSHGANYLAQLAALNQYCLTVLQTIPHDHRVLIGAHDAFRYMGRAYDLNARGVEGISTEPDVNLRDVNVLADLIVGKKIPAVFTEATVTKAHVQQLVEAVKAKLKNLPEEEQREISIAGPLLSDNPGAPGTRQATFVGMIEYDVNTVTKALGGTVPAKGFVTIDDIRAASTKPAEKESR